MDSRLHGCMAALCCCFALLAGVGTATANERPDATFGFFPSNPVVGQSVRFVSYACDPDGTLFDQGWEFDGHGAFDDAFGPQTTHVFPTAGPHMVALRVIPLEGAPVVRRARLNVGTGAPVPETFTPPPLNPFPIVRIVGQLTERGARIRFLSVTAPVCTRVITICHGRSCPFKQNTRVVGWSGLRVRPLAGVRLQAGVRLELLVTKPDRVGKYTRFTIRRGKPPLRVDSCLEFAQSRPSGCG